MDPLEELKKELTDVGQELTTLRALGDDLNDSQLAKYQELSKKALKLKARIEGLEAEAEANKVAKAQEEEAVQKRIDVAVAEATAKEAAKYRRPAFVDSLSPRIAQYQDTYKYDQLDATELSLMMEMQHRLGMRITPGAYKALSFRVAEMKDSNDEESRKAIAYVKNAFKAGTRGVDGNGIDPTKEGVEAAIKAATDPMYTGASPMSDWVGTAYSQEIWRKIRAAVVVANRVPSDVIPDGYSSKIWPLESTDLTWYKVAEATTSDGTLKVPAATVTASQIATGNKTLSVGKIGARGLYTGEAEEDSLIAFAPQLRQQLEKSGAEILEHLIVDGDTETSANKNINDIAGTPAATDVFLLMDGFRKLALVTNTANSRSASGSFVVTDFKDTLKLMGTAGLNGADPTAVAFIVDYNVMWATMDLAELKTRDVSNIATIENGFVTRIYRTEILNSYQMHRIQTDRKANTAGKIDQDTPGNNTTGSILAVRFDQWKQAYKRRMTMEVTRIANADSWEIVALMRWGLAYRDNEASAITYNVGI